MDHRLLNDLQSLVIDINIQIDAFKREARKQSIPPYLMKDMNGNFMLTPLLVAKASALNGVAVLKSGK